MLPVSAVLVLVCTFAGRSAVLAAGCVAAVTVAVGVTLTARRNAADRREAVHGEAARREGASGA
ncbi:hypothetical protein GCM10020221_06120 [Streptomyces thioluteus]|uniref:Uncharacterized protein n=1 Tax=Streptomyces thioluteus TaxID=66431 RepID=A0ABP6IXQ2_STRTU